MASNPTRATLPASPTSLSSIATVFDSPGVIQTLENPKLQAASPRPTRSQDAFSQVSVRRTSGWPRIRRGMRDAVSEFLGTMILIIFGTGVNCQVTLSSSSSVTSSDKGQYLSVSFGWACGVAIGAWVAGRSGAHINPAVTLALSVFRGFPLKKVPVYIASQVAGAFTGALVVYGIYASAIDAFEGASIRSVPGTAGLFGTYAQSYVPPAACFFNEFLGTLLLMMFILAITDKKSGPPPAGLVPLALFIVILGIGASLGMNTGYAINPARDFGPRLMTWIFWGNGVWNFRSQYWLWCPIIAPICGALAGAFVYDAFIFDGEEASEDGGAQIDHV